MIKKFINGVKKGKVKMRVYKSVRCNRCRCQDICKIENEYRTIQKKIDEIMGDGDSFFSIPELVCSHYVPGQNAEIRNVTSDSETSNEYLNNYIGEANKNGRA